MKQNLNKNFILTVSLMLVSAQTYATELNVGNNTKSAVKSSQASLDSKKGSSRTGKKNSSEYWTGLYGGINLGGNFTDAELRSNQKWLYNQENKCNKGGSIDGFTPGVQLGYLHEFDSKFVLGAEADFTYNTQDQANLDCPCTAPGANQTDQFTAENRLQGSLRGRFGYVINKDLLPFISAGVSFADMGLKYNGQLNGINQDFYSKNTSQAGWLVGGGLEWGTTDSISVRGEYYYTAYNTINMAIPNLQSLPDPNGNSHLNLSSHTVRVAINYWF